MVLYMGHPDLAGSLRVDWGFSWFPIWGTGIWPVSPRRLGFFVLPYMGNRDLASLTG